MLMQQNAADRHHNHDRAQQRHELSLRQEADAQGNDEIELFFDRPATTGVQATPVPKVAWLIFAEFCRKST